MKLSLKVSLIPAVLAAACGPSPFEGEWQLSELIDTNADPHIVEVNINAVKAQTEFLQGTSTSVWTYNGVTPGPVLRANVGDRVIVHFENNLDRPTTIHWHGLRIPASMDGTEVVQSPIEPGGGFTYDFVVPDAELAWFHPHLDSAEQVERGLQAAFLIEDPNDPLPEGRVMVLDDVLLDDTGQIVVDQHMGMNGHRGNVLLVNGHRRPVLEAAAGSMQRWRLVNTSNARHFHLSLAEARLRLVGTDDGPLANPIDVDAIDLSPGERVDVVVNLPDSVGEVEVMNRDDQHMAWFNDEALLVVRTTAAAAETFDVPSTLAEFKSLPEPDVIRRVTFAGGMGAGGMGAGGMGNRGAGAMMSYTINGEQWPDVTPLQGQLGHVEQWRVVNETGVDHPFHLHGTRFQVEGVDGFKDTVNVPAHADVSLRFAADNPGRWLFHCHILEHAEAGMMGEFDVD